MNIDKRIRFDERYDNSEFHTTTLYFTAPVDLLEGKYPEAESMEISVEFPTDKPEAEYADVMFSPTKDGLDYDWFRVDMSRSEIEELIALPSRNCHALGGGENANPFSGKSVAITGKLNNYTRAGIKERLLELGARPATSVSSKTSYLIVGEKPGSKLTKAQMLGITILSEQEFENMAG